jgi:hypothetical protein
MYTLTVMADQPAAPSPDPLPAAASVLSVVAVALWAVFLRLDAALVSLLGTKRATGVWHGPSTGGLVAWWLVVGAALLTLLALFVIVRSVPKPRSPAVFNILGVLLMVAWAVWIIVDAVIVTLDGRLDYHLFRYLTALVALLLVATLVALGHAFGVSARFARQQASAVRVHMFVLGLLFAVAFLVPLTSGQAIDIMRAWTDEGLNRPAAALAGALLLGEMIRESGLRLIAADPVLGTELSDPARRPNLRVFRAMAAAPVFVLFLGSVTAAADSLLLDQSWSDTYIRRTCFGALVVSVVMAIFVRTVLEPVGPVQYQSTPGLGAIRMLAGWIHGVLARAWSFLIGLIAALPQPVPPSWRAAVVALRRQVAGVLFVDPPGRSGWRSTGLLIAIGFGLGLLVAGLPVFSVALAVVFVVFVEWQRRSGNVDEPIPGAPSLNVSRGLALGFGAMVLWEPIGTARGVGVVAVILIFLAGVLGLLHSAVSAARWIARRSWHGHHLRVPVVTLLVAWFALSTQCAQKEQHQARAVSVGSSNPPTLAVAVGDWLDQESARARIVSGISGSRYLPMLLVGASGGGSKAAYWTDLVLDCIVGGKVPSETIKDTECDNDAESVGMRQLRARGLFLTSSVSGGSIGVRNYVSRIDDVVTGGRWVDQTAGHEVLAPTVAWGLYHDLAATMLHLPTDPRECTAGGEWSCRWNLDRAAVQENTIARQPWDAAPDPSQALSRIWSQSVGPAGASHPVPLTIFNMAVTGGVGRVLASPVDLSPLSVFDDRCPAVKRSSDGAVVGAVDASDLYVSSGRSTHDLPLTTAALLSGRFPVVDPVGRVGDSSSIVRSGDQRRLRRCLDGTVNTLPAVFVRDGGYVENTGLLTIVQALPAIQQGIADWKLKPGNADVKVVIWVLSIDDDPSQLDSPSYPEAHRPGPTSIGSKASDVTLTTMARDALAIRTDGVACYGRVSPEPLIGAHASTGWELSLTVRVHDLTASLRREGQNYRRLMAVRDFLSGTLGNPSACPL